MSQKPNVEIDSDKSFCSDSDSSGFETYEELIKWMSKKKVYKIKYKRPNTDDVSVRTKSENSSCKSQIAIPDDKELEEGMLSIDF